MTSRDKGAAFPHSRKHAGVDLGQYPGMTLRDWLAGQALAGIMANPERWKQIASDYESGKKTYAQCSLANATKAYDIADAMIAARQEGEKSDC